MSAAPRGRLGVLVRTFPKLSETFVLNELLGLEEAGFELRIFALQRPTDPVQQTALARLRAEVVYLGVPGAAPGDLSDESLAEELAADLRAWRARHLHVHFIDRPGRIGARAAELAGIGFSLSAHAKDIYLGEPAAIADLLESARFTTTCTAANRDVLALLAPRGAPLYCIYHGIDVALFASACRPSRDAPSWPRASSRESAAAPATAPEPASAPRRPRLLAVGRLRPKKGFDSLIEAVALLRSRGQPVDCEIVGYGEQQAALEQLANRLGVSDLVQLRGRRNHAELLKFYARADLFAAPCRIAADGDRDGIPNVLLEAMAAGLAVISTPVSGVPELVQDGWNGLLVPPSDSVALGDAIEQLLADAVLRTQLGERAASTVNARFGRHGNLRELVDLLGACIAESTSPHAVPAARVASLVAEPGRV